MSLQERGQQLLTVLEVAPTASLTDKITPFVQFAKKNNLVEVVQALPRRDLSALFTLEQQLLTVIFGSGIFASDAFDISDVHLCLDAVSYSQQIIEVVIKHDANAIKKGTLTPFNDTLAILHGKKRKQWRWRGRMR